MLLTFSTNTRRGFVLAALLSASSTAALAQDAPIASVTVAVVKPVTYTLTARLPGRIKASTEAEVRPQISGIIRERLFEEGASVEKGQELYKIDDENYVSAVASAKAAVAEAQANYDLAVIEARRAADLFEKQSGTASSRDNTAAQKLKADASLQRARAELKTAEIDLDRTTIRAPIGGAIGLSETTQGALVASQQTTALTTIRTLDPIFVDVTQSATDLLRWNATGGAGGLDKGATATMILPDGTTYPLKGNLTAAEPRVEPTTGMVTLRISFANPDHRLLPGLYVEVDLPQATADNAILVPQSAVMRNSKGEPSAWVVSNDKVEQRPLTVFAAAGNELVTTAGLREGDAVITSGFQKTGPGATVKIIDTASNQAPSANEGN
ncbi:efflux RND transporter periplasmic adaptor subunit [Agrobacterium tumefaciens]|uniref:Efflux RND transporter periplasmic adaptor subunit n=1 Tax=Agrobacterium tumefaciens TaxID=358 RepID=A0AA44F5W1_AGRTU|nr:efflux RND transporter periplasmic adaptor subunit [Agrobacterium tumefaciens]NSL21200.1 efflux RND transporter periplasmic adaptor subunit [Agrobacterium tumefaciens]NTB83772.1 efflux RND transporter periplasmic adaptor subunit [Agrobacterium tumefaciens]NTC20759.1 efflux RND transporter periplasmic adaptor subunit [Agrobacterium tumefaciens]NTC29243.1 efflux RND transporter periplasmic adaptor subunit [Agrobacterium tumefaciens]NTC57523.1 efflux RND transporter periplasmic adaptor subunit